MTTTKKQTNIPKFTKRELIELINDTAQATVSASATSQDINYFHATEKLLYNYRRLEALVGNEAEYIDVETRRTSTSLIHYSHGSSANACEPAVQLRQQRSISYQRTKARFDEIAQVVRLFEDEKEFAVIRMYYFGEDAYGIPRLDSDKRYTWEEIAEELNCEGILRTEKTARCWRNRIVNDIAVCLFGKPAAVSFGRYRIKRA